ncbi:beta-mannosidase [Rathayibacter sp. PhB127]|uniref:glycoside hydrolase family 2 protein n=1 Tax=Rathayibacter sp. PhB127 TaxID=2485176 RepID=UPI000F4C2CAA|nr:glycoside hydrolase family 2 protein [Rathayibacter sp. PhB127]ROS21563.1 beta-mannosidase [Rathayibacter sp. PhB127]
MALLPLHTGWTLEALAGPVPPGIADRAIPAAVPGCAHTDLLAAGLIAEPFDGDNESAQQWIGSTIWRYRTSFEWSEDGADRHDLVADGLDTVATIELNGTVVARTQNQHRGYRLPVDGLLVEGENVLVITFAAPVEEAEARSAEHGERPHVNHHPYNALRKSASNFGWDWGIDVATSGIWKPIGLDSWSGVRIASVRPLVGVEGTDGVLDAHVALEWAGDEVAPVVLRLEIDGAEVAVEVPAGATQATVRAVVPDAELWWPRGHGAQPLHPVAVTVDGTAAEWSGRVGFRTVRVDTTPDEEGTPFVIVVNDEPVQIRGANWIPDHAFVTEIDAARYRRRVQDAVDANMNLLRVWGGGIYESDDFYDACDEAGVLVWQDFLFACAAYAEEEWLAEEVEQEARGAITRLSVHPSLVLWNGNNENLWGYVEWQWRHRLAGASWGDGYYRELLPRLVAELDPTRPYSPGSPFSFLEYAHPNDPRNGTMHIWDVWNTHDYTVYRDYAPRFVSEFGFQGPPAWSTLTAVVHDEPLDPYGEQMLVHQKAHEGNLKLERGLQGHLPAPTSIEDWHWATQLNQAAALRFGIEHFRSLAPLNTGTIVWQLNDNWPVVSWAAVDFDEHRKPLWYALRDAYAPRLATVQPREGGLAVVLLNDTADEWTGTVAVSRRRLDGTVLATGELVAAVGARGAETLTLPEDVAAVGDPADEIVVVDVPGAARALWNPAEVVDQHLDPDPVSVSAEAVDGGFEVTVTAHAFARDVALLVDLVDPRATVDTALVTLLAGEAAVFHVTGAAGADPASFTAAVRHANGLLTAARA